MASQADDALIGVKNARSTIDAGIHDSARRRLVPRIY